MQINALLDAGLRRHDEIMAPAAIFNKLLESRHRAEVRA